MGKRFVFVSGDMGGANYQLPVISELIERGHEIAILADLEGNGADSFQKSGFPFEADVSSKDLDRLFRSADLFFINTCASASKLEERVLSKVLGGVKTVMGSDGLFNHGFTKWRAVPDNTRLFWFAINEGHAEAIRELRPNLKPERVIVVGQPAFDSVLDYIPRKAEVRAQAREALGVDRSIPGDTVLLWWSQGMLDVISEDVCMLLHGLSHLASSDSFVRHLTLIPRIHPKLDKTVSAGYVNQLRRLLYSCFENEINIVEANDMRAEELCLAADVILSITCTEDVRNVMMGGPPVVHMLGPLTRRWFEKELGQTSPYLPDIRSGQSLVAWSVEDVGRMVEMALDPVILAEYSKNWQAPTQKATAIVTDKLIEIASS